MTRTWHKPPYLYRPEPMGAQLRRLLGEFLRANTNDRAGLAQALGCSTEFVDRAVAGEVNTKLVTTFLTTFTSLTGISLDRLMVIEAKLQILDKYMRVAQLRTTDPSYAFLLDLDPGLAEKISFERLRTRDEIVAAVKEVADEIGAPLTAAQMFMNDRFVFSWWGTKAQRPSGEYLERAIIMLAVGFIRNDPKAPSRDESCFRIMARQLLGCDPKAVLGVSTLQEALDRFFKGSGNVGYTSSILATRYNIGRSTTEALRAWKPEPGRGLIMPSTMLAIIRALLNLQGHKDAVPALERAFAVSEGKGSRGWPGKPVFWPDGPVVVTPGDADTDTIEALVPPEEPAGLVEAQAPAQTPVSKIPLTVRLAFVQAVAALDLLLAEYPELAPQLPASLKAGEDWFLRLARGQGPLSADERQRLVIFLRGFPDILGRLLRNPLEERTTTLRACDDPLVRVQHHVDAMESPEPRKYLELMLGAQLGGRIAGGEEE